MLFCTLIHYISEENIFLLSTKLHFDNFIYFTDDNFIQWIMFGLLNIKKYNMFSNLYGTIMVSDVKQNALSQMSELLTAAPNNGLTWSCSNDPISQK